MDLSGVNDSCGVYKGRDESRWWLLWYDVQLSSSAYRFIKALEVVQNPLLQRK